jgi:transcriptional regulator with XRE-family HTH domain
MGDGELSLGQTLKSMRELRGGSLKTVADRAEISAAYLQKLERDEVVTPSPHVLHRLAGVLGAEYLELMRLAGYVVPEAPGAGGTLAQALSAQDLTEDEARALATFLKMYRSGEIG